MCAKVTNIILSVYTIRLLEMDISKFAVALWIYHFVCLKLILVCVFFFIHCVLSF